jgi:photosystem II stability/assembly factor-like uncharacterized protein
MTSPVPGCDELSRRRRAGARAHMVLAMLLLSSACARIGSDMPQPRQQPAQADQEDSSNVQAMQLVEANQGWALTEQHLVWTDNGGVAWRDITPPATPPDSIGGAFFLDPSRGWSVSKTLATSALTEFTVFRTVDGGRTWLPALVKASVDTYGGWLHFVDPQHGWLVVRLQSSSNFRLGELFRTTDGGVTWMKQSIPIGDPVRFASTSTGFTAGGAPGDELYVTVDGGDSWQPQSVTPPAPFRSSSLAYSLPIFINPQEGVLPVTFSGEPSGAAFYITRDGGETWTLRATLPAPESLEPGQTMRLDLVDGSQWFVGLSRARERLFATRDGGTRWEELVTTGLRKGVVALDFATGSVGWAHTSHGAESELWKTDDGGRNWVALNP